MCCRPQLAAYNSALCRIVDVQIILLYLSDAVMAFLPSVSESSGGIFAIRVRNRSERL